ncbi:MAG: hypothetical protein U0836_16980 [Pirellulales bacterium]
MVFAILLVAAVRIKVEQDRTEAVWRQKRRWEQSYETRLRLQGEAWSRLVDEANDLRARLGEPRRPKTPSEHAPIGDVYTP